MSSQTPSTCSYCGVALPPFAHRCPQCLRDACDTGQPQSPIKPTIREEVAIVASDARKQPPTSDGAVAFRPVMRLKRAMLCILDDGSKDGEWVRIRNGQLKIGRTEGDVIIPDDEGISGRHAEVIRRAEGGYPRWFLRDLGSRNGTFVKVSKARLTDGVHILLGLRRFVFELPKRQPTEAEPPPSRQMTRAWAIPGNQAGRPVPPRLVEMGQAEPLMTIELGTKELTIGSSEANVNFVIKDDPTISPVHARVAQDAAGRWEIEGLKSLNGVWCQVEEIGVDETCTFQLGEQQFVLRVM